MKEDFWAHLDRPDDRTGRMMVVRSPGFETQPELFDWIKRNQIAGDELQAWRRDLSDGGFKDVSLVDRDALPADPQRLAALLEEARATLDAGRKKMRPMGRQHVNDRERGLEARQRLENAGAALKPEPTKESA